MENYSNGAREARNAYQREWNRRNRTKVNAYLKKWRKKNPDKVKAANQRYWEKKALELGLEVLTGQSAQAIVKANTTKSCSFCGIEFEPSRSDQKYCCDSHRQLDYIARKEIRTTMKKAK